MILVAVLPNWSVQWGHLFLGGEKSFADFEYPRSLQDIWKEHSQILLIDHAVTEMEYKAKNSLCRD